MQNPTRSNDYHRPTSRRTRSLDPRSQLQPLQTAQRSGHDRPADRLGNGFDERPPVGGHDDRRRKLRRRFVLFPLRDHRTHWHALPAAHASGPRGERLLGAAQSGRHRAGQLHFDTTKGHRVPARHAVDCTIDEAADTRRNCRSREKWTSPSSKAPARKPAREGSVRGADHHQQHSGRTARVDAQYPRDGRSMPPLQSALLLDWPASPKRPLSKPAKPVTPTRRSKEIVREIYTTPTS